MAKVKLDHIYKVYENGFEGAKDINLDINDKVDKDKGWLWVGQW